MPTFTVPSLKRAWMITLKDLSEQPPTKDLLFWLGGVSFVSEQDNKISFAIKNGFIHKTFKAKEYDKLIQSRLEEMTGTPILCEWIISDSLSSDEKEENLNSESTLSPSETRGVAYRVERQEPALQTLTTQTVESIPAPPKPKVFKPNPTLNEKYTFENFILGDNNQFAYNTAQSITQRPGQEQNPCLIYGPVGLGKTHLMQSVGQSLYRNNQKLNVLYLTAETFLNEFQEALKTQEQFRFKNKYRYIDVLLIDDIHDLQNKEATQEELFHTFEALYNANKQMIFTCDRPPRELKNFTERLKSRFERGVVVSISQPSWETRLEILRQNYETYRQIVPTYLSDAVLRFTAKTINSNIRVLESALRTLANYNVSMKTEITPELAHNLLQDFVEKRKHKKQRELTLDYILESVASTYHVGEEEILSSSRVGEIVQARKIFIHIARSLTQYSTPQIGVFLERHHSSVLSAQKALKKELSTNALLAEQVKELTHKIQERDL